VEGRKGSRGVEPSVFAGRRVEEGVLSSPHNSRVLKKKARTGRAIGGGKSYSLGGRLAGKGGEVSVNVTLKIGIPREKKSDF